MKITHAAAPPSFRSGSYRRTNPAAVHAPDAQAPFAIFQAGQQAAQASPSTALPPDRGNIQQALAEMQADGFKLKFTITTPVADAQAAAPQAAALTQSQILMSRAEKVLKPLQIQLDRQRKNALQAQSRQQQHSATHPQPAAEAALPSTADKAASAPTAARSPWCAPPVQGPVHAACSHGPAHCCPDGACRSCPEPGPSNNDLNAHVAWSADEEMECSQAATDPGVINLMTATVRCPSNTKIMKFKMVRLTQRQYYEESGINKMQRDHMAHEKRFRSRCRAQQLLDAANVKTASGEQLLEHIAITFTYWEQIFAEKTRHCFSNARCAAASARCAVTAQCYI